MANQGEFNDASNTDLYRQTDQDREHYSFMDWVASEDPSYAKKMQSLFMDEAGDGQALSIKYREMIIIGILAFRGRKEGVIAHMRRAIEHGATKRELFETAQSCHPPGGGPTFAVLAQALMHLDNEEAFKND